MKIGFQKALVTGGAGFIGSHLVAELLDGGCAVKVLDNLSTGRLENLAPIKERIEFVQGDIRDDDALVESVSGCDIVFHQAAVVSVAQTVQDPVTSALVNDLGTLRVLDAARRHGVRRVVLASSSAVYGDAPQLPKTESMAPAPMSPYAVQKLTNEHYAELYYRLYRLETVCLRYFNVFGPRQDPSSPYSGVISIFMTRASRHEAPVIYGDGTQTRDFVYVSDVVRANLLAAIHPDAAGRVFNVGTSHSVSIGSLWQRVAGLAGTTTAARHGDARPGDILHSLASIQRAREVLGFQPAMRFEEGLRRTFEWYRQSS